MVLRTENRFGLREPVLRIDALGGRPYGINAALRQRAANRGNALFGKACLGQGERLEIIELGKMLDEAVVILRPAQA